MNLHLPYLLKKRIPTPLINSPAGKTSTSGLAPMARCTTAIKLPAATCPLRPPSPCPNSSTRTGNGATCRKVKQLRIFFRAAPSRHACGPRTSGPAIHSNSAPHAGPPLAGFPLLSVAGARLLTLAEFIQRTAHRMELSLPNIRIPLRGFNIMMAQQFLYECHVRSGFQQVRSVTVP